MRFIGAIVLVALLLTTMMIVVRAGYSRELAYAATQSGHLTTADRAITLAPSDPEAYLARAFVLLNAGDFEQSYKEYERAIALRPHDYYLWFRLGYAHYFADDQQGAIKPFQEAVNRAPYYAKPRWMLGKMLLATGQRDEAFRELRRAASSNPVYMADVIALAWDAYGDQPETIEQVIKPQTSSEYLKLALSLVSHGKTGQAMRLFRQTVDLSEEDKREFVIELLNAKQFAEAYEVWSQGKEGSPAAGQITNGSFENRVAKEEQEFGWQFSPAVGDEAQFSRDTNWPRDGQYSLRLDFGGNVDPSLNLVSTLVVVQPNSSYRLAFAARTKDLATGGLPIIGINDASNDGQTLAESSLLPQGTSDWQSYLVEFSTSTTTRAVYLNIRRKLCSAGCPITGHLWVDNFSLQKL
jgi:tetratricopeptide (TPR) repeat protein